MKWQTLINEVYEYWQSGDYSYTDVLKYANDRFGNLGELAILVKNYNYQVENGGHIQYFDNGYASGDGGCFCKHDVSCPLHWRMVELMEILGLSEIEECKPVYDIMLDFSVEQEDEHTDEYTETCVCCNGAGVDENDICDYCDGNGYIYEEEYFEGYTYVNDALDTAYYEVNTEFVDFFEQYIENHTQEL